MSQLATLQFRVTRASDGDGGFATATVSINVSAAAAGSIITVPDSCLGGTALVITGASGNDSIKVEPGSSSSTFVVFQTIDGSGTRGERVVHPLAVKPDGTQLTVIVPNDVAVTGTVGIVGDQNNMQVLLQIVPVLTNVDFTSIASDGTTAQVTLRGEGRR